MHGNFSMLAGADGPTSVFYAGKLGKGSLLPIGIAVLAAALAAAVALFFKKRR